MSKYYTPTKIDRKKATYNVVFGERSNGKTFALLRKGIMLFMKEGKQSAYVRRWKEDITGRRASRLFDGITASGEVDKITKGKFKGVHYYAGKWYLCNYGEDGKAIYSDSDLFCFAFALSDGEHDKSTSYPNVGLVIFDEFLTNKLYLQDEFVAFANVISTIVRRRDGVKIYMLGNTVNKYCPYFQEMGLTNVPQQKQGSIDVYTYGESDLTVAVEYCASIDSDEKAASNKYFAFNNPKLGMITGGAWEINIYPHLPMKYKPKDILLTYFIEFNDNIYQCEVIQIGDVAFTYIHIKTTPIKDVVNDLVYSFDYSPRPNYNRSVFKPTSKTQEKIAWFYRNDLIYYQDNHVGDAINNFLKICKRS